jgi:protein arginine N-methyltransferase 3
VYAIEASDMAPHTEMIVAKNGLSNIVEVIHGKVEQIQLPVEQVDVIISEWMGIFLLFVSIEYNSMGLKIDSRILMLIWCINFFPF